MGDPPVPPESKPDVNDDSKKHLEESRGQYSRLKMNAHLRHLHDFGANMVKAGNDFQTTTGKPVTQDSGQTNIEDNLVGMAQKVSTSSAGFDEFAAFAKELEVNNKLLTDFVTATGKGFTSYGYAILDAVTRYDDEDQNAKRELDKVDFSALKKVLQAKPKVESDYRKTGPV